MPQANLRVELSADPSKLVGGFKSAEAAAKVIERELARVEKAERSLVAMQMQAEREMRATFAARERAAKDLARAQMAARAEAGKVALAFGGVLAGGLALSARAAMQWESAWAGVRKVVNGTPEQMAALERDLRGLATSMPVSAKEIAGVAEAAGQLGVETANIKKFTDTAIRLGVSTNLSAEDAATGLAKLGNIMGVTADQVDRAGAALVALGNDGASTEQDILQMAVRIAGAGRIVGLSEAKVLAYANALSSLGIEAEAGGTAISRVFLTIDGAARSGGATLDAFARTAGMSSEAFKKAWAEDAAGATAKFITGLQRIQDQGGNVNQTLQQLNLDEIRVRDTLLRTAGGAAILTKSLGLSTDAWKQNIALVAESNRRFETSESKIKIAGNRLNDMAIDVGARVLPAFVTLADGVGSLAHLFGELPGPMKTAVVVLGSITAGVTLMGGAAAVTLPRIVALRAALEEMGPLGSKASAGMGALGTALTGPVGVGITAGLTVATIALGKWAKGQADAKRQAEALAAAIREDNGAIGENTALQVYAALKSNSGLVDLAAKFAVNMNDLTQAALGNKDALAKVNGQLESYYTNVEKSGGNTFVARTEIGQLQSSIENQTGKIAANRAEWERQQEVIKGAKQTMGSLDEKTREQARAQAILAANTHDSSEAMKALKDALDSLNRPYLDLRETERQAAQSIADANKALKENGRTLSNNTEKGRANGAALDAMAQAFADHAKAVLDSTGNERQFITVLEGSRRQLIEQGIRFGLTAQQARDYADKVLQIPKNVRTDVELRGLAAARAELLDFADAVSRLAGEAGAAVTAGAKAPRKKRASGGWIAGPPSKADRVPAMLSTNEYVMQSDAVSHYGIGFMDAINARRYASGGLVTTSAQPSLGGLYATYTSSLGSPVTGTDRSDAVRRHRDAVDALRVATLKLDEVERARHATALQVEQAEVRQRKAREALAAATSQLSALDARAAAQRQAPLSRLSSALSVGIRDGAAFVANVETLAARGFGELARQLAEMGDADAERMAADAVRARPGTVKALQDRLITATRVQQQRSQLGEIARVVDAMRARPGGSIDDLASMIGSDVPTTVGLLQLLGSRLGSLPGGRHYQALIPRAGGGRVEVGGAYLVGEQRAELFVPDRPGRIVPHVTVSRTSAAAAAGGSGGDTWVIQAPTTNARDLVREGMAEARRMKAVRVR